MRGLRAGYGRVLRHWLRHPSRSDRSYFRAWLQRKWRYSRARLGGQQAHYDSTWRAYQRFEWHPVRRTIHALFSENSNEVGHRMNGISPIDRNSTVLVVD